MTAGHPVVALVVVAMASGVAPPAVARQVVNNLVAAAQPLPFSADDLLFMEVTADGYQLAETMNVYASRAGVFVPLGEFARVLDFAVGVFPAERRAEGWVQSRDRQLKIDLDAGSAIVGDRIVTFSRAQVAIYDNDLYVRADLAEQLLPLKLRPDVNAQTLAVQPTEPLPFQQRLAREARAAGLGARQAQTRVAVIDTPYALFTAPAFDVNLGGMVTRDGQDQTRSYDVRMAGDLAHAGFQGFVGSDQHGELNDVRVLFERKDASGHALGRFGGRRAAAGDVFSPSMALGAGSVNGRGLYYSSAPLEVRDLATPLNLRGELPLGEEVELYVNEVLQATRTSADHGRYEFLDVPLTYGLNTIRLVFYGPQGQSREEVRRINFGSGQIEAGRLVMRLAALEQNRTVFEINSAPDDPTTGEIRLAALFDYGISPALTVSGGVSRYSPRGQALTVGQLGLRGSLSGLGTQIDVASDSQGGSGATVGLAGRLYGISVVTRHAEYWNGFIDETRQIGISEGMLLKRASDFRADGQIRIGDDFNIPLSLDMRRIERINGAETLNAEFRTSAPIDRYYLSTSLSYAEERTPVGRQRGLFGAIDVATLIAARAQFRGGLSYRVSPEVALDSAYATADIQLNDRSTLRLSAVHSLGVRETTAFQASAFYRASRFDVSLTGAYETDSGDWRLGLQMGFGLTFDRDTRRYEVVRPGVSTGGSVAFDAFVDANGDGVRQAGEAPVPNVVLETQAGAVVTDAEGRAFAPGLGDGAAVQMRVNLEGIDDPFMLGKADAIRTAPRPGRTAVVSYAMQQSGEIELTVLLDRPGVERRPLAAVNLRLEPEDARPVIAARSDHAGVVFIEGAAPGTYRIRLDPQQAADLGLSVDGDPVVVVPPDGGFVRFGDIVVRLAGGGTA